MIDPTEHEELIRLRHENRYLRRLVALIRFATIEFEDESPPVRAVDQVPAFEPPKSEPVKLEKEPPYSPREWARKPLRPTGPKQQQVLELLQAQPGVPVPTAEIIEAVWGQDSVNQRSYLAAIIRSLKEHYTIETVRSGSRFKGGYRLIPPDQQDVEYDPDDPNQIDYNPGLCEHPEGYCVDYRQGLCQHCNDHDFGVVCPKRHRKEQAHERVYG